MIALAIMVLGVVFMYAGKIESLIFDKTSGIASKEKLSIFCKKKKTEWAID